MQTRNILTARLACSAFLLLLATLFLQPLWTRFQDRAAKSKPYGRYSADQITRRTEKMCLDLAPEPSGLSFTSFSLSAYDRKDRQFQRIWQVEYTGKLQGIFEWNADTGRLMKFSQNLPPMKCTSAPLTQAQAIRICLYWIEKLQMGREELWRQEGAAEYDQQVWTCRLLSAQTRIQMKIRASDGLLTFAQITDR